MGLPREPTTVASVSWPERAEPQLRALLRERSGFVQRAPWYESDHMLFAAAGIPSLAVTSAGPLERLARLSNSPAGNLASVDPSKLAAVSTFLLDAVPTLLRSLGGSSPPGGQARIPAAIEV